MITHLTISIELNEDTEEGSVKKAEQLLRGMNLPDNAKMKLLRDKDRSGGNLLLPRLDGRFGEHLQGRKATLDDLG